MLGAFLVFIMFFSVVAYSFQTLTRDLENQNPEAKKIDYNGFEFTEQNGFWVLNKDGNSFIFKFNPNQVERINVELNPLESYYNKILYLNSESVEAEAETRINLAGFVSKIEKCLQALANLTMIISCLLWAPRLITEMFRARENTHMFSRLLKMPSD